MERMSLELHDELKTARRLAWINVAEYEDPGDYDDNDPLLDCRDPDEGDR
jgi:hypothetical protein